MARKTVVKSHEAAAKIRAARESQGFTVAEAAKRCGISHQAFSDLERGRKSDGSGFSISLDRLWLIAVALEVDPSSLDERLASTKGKAVVVPSELGPEELTDLGEWLAHAAVEWITKRTGSSNKPGDH